MKRRALLVGSGASLVALAEGVPSVASASPVSDRYAPARGSVFASSFEADDRPLDWTSTVETDKHGTARMSGVTGAAPTGIPGSIVDKITKCVASGENPPNEIAANLLDADPSTKWLAFTATAWAEVQLSEPIAVVAYALTSANDHAERDPKNWTLQGSTDGTQWTDLDTRTGESFDHRYQLRQFSVDNTTKYSYYRLNVTANGSGDIVQLADLQLSNGDDAPPPQQDMLTAVGTGPASGPNVRPKVGFTGVASLEFAGQHTADGRAFAYNKIYDVELSVGRHTRLAYTVFPVMGVGDLSYASTYVALDLAFSDGTYLSQLSALDQHGIAASPSGQGAGNILYPNQWNSVVIDVGAVAAGKKVERILFGYDKPSGPAQFRGWLDDIRLGDPVADTRSRPTDYVLTTRGTNASGDFSRGNNIPATAVPNGFNFWVPVTDAGSTSWLYAYQKANNAANLPELQAFSVSHEPSPWMGDRQTFQVMPSAASGTPDADRDTRALAFSHDDETAQAHRYAVTFTNGIAVELAPTDHAAIFRFRFPGSDASLIFDNVDNDGGLTLDADGRSLHGYSDVRVGTDGATRLFVYAEFDRPVTDSGMLPGGGGKDVTGFFRFDAGATHRVTMRIATSLLSVAQAKHNLALEISSRDSLESVRERARQAWEKRLGVIEVEGATPDQLTTLYSNLYRLNLYPNSGFENVGTNRQPTYRYASPVSKPIKDPTAAETGAKIVDGTIYVNHGFWDVYRTAWPAYALLYPSVAGRLVQGFVQQYLDGGWISRWSSPGYADLMTGTSSDVAFADAFLKGVKGFDPKDAYDAAVRNASVAPTSSAIGRKGLETSIFLGYTPDSTGESVSWALEGFVNDFGIGNMAAALAERATAGSAEARRYAEEADYYLRRCRNYVYLFDPEIGFFQGFDAKHRPRLEPNEYDPRVWGNDYTETDGWNFAFHVAHDGNGLANLYGGRDRLAAKLDEFFRTPETAQYPGSYGGTIHEMLEARDVRMGQYGHSNQPSHHITYMYTYAGQPWKTQQKVREVLQRLYTGSEIGQGYCGDEDNGEMSAWWIFSALGIYPLQMGSPRYAIGSPLFRKATVHLESGHDLVVNAPGNSVSTVYVRGLRVNGQRYEKSFVDHATLARGARLDFTMGAKPSRWGSGADAAPPSLTTGTDVAIPLTDVTAAADASASDGTDVDKLANDTSADQVTFGRAAVTVDYQLDAAAKVTHYTLTSGTAEHGDPVAWTLSGSTDGTGWTVLDTRSDEAFTWRRQTRPFTVAKPGSYPRYRLDVTATTGGAPLVLAQVELLDTPADPPVKPDKSR
ncbi:GH92 family glycosyl hydrolase [Actinocatenispora sera]|uniref:GH92 family glycosyl hydrolase n=1 Tax=Actinocatenispora sera TaxID=390989 RepID=UPI0033F9387A